MTEPTTTPLHDPGSAIAVPATNILLTLVVTLLAPMFIGVCAGDIALARAAALETITDYRAQNHASLLAVAQIIACGLAALGSLSLSMEDDISLSMTLRLRGNAVALNRAAEQNRRAHKQGLDDTAQPAPMTETGMAALQDQNINEDEVIAGVIATQKRVAEAQNRLWPSSAQPDPLSAAAPSVDAPLTDEQRQIQAMWASAMADVAGEVTAGLANLPPAERRAASLQAAALTNASNTLLSGVHVPAPTLPIPRFPTAI
jgi:hypothetical protein